MDIDAGRSSVYTASEVGKAPSVDEWQKDREWMFDETDEWTTAKPSLDHLRAKPFGKRLVVKQNTRRTSGSRTKNSC
jgi:hypothetical protein